MSLAINLSRVLCTLLCFGWLVQKGDLVALKQGKKTATVIKLLDKVNPQNKWNGWVVIDPPLGGFSRWPVEDLRLVLPASRRLRLAVQNKKSQA
jgi:hypothetical protein